MVAFSISAAFFLFFFFGFFSPADAASAQTGETAEQCPLTPRDSLGPFYKPNALMRSKVGDGYALTGTVRSGDDCSPIPEAKIEFWLAGPDREYDDAHRATMYSGRKGGYRFESNYPPPYSSRPSHIHIKVTAKGHEELVTQHYPEAGEKTAEFDIVLAPAKT